MTVYEMKCAIRKVYNTNSWRRKVDAMYDDQVIAIYCKFQEEGKLDKVLRNERPKPPEQYVQMTIFELLNKENKHA